MTRGYGLDWCLATSVIPVLGTEVATSPLIYLLFYREGNDPGDACKITYGDLLKQVCKFSNVLKNIGKNFY